MIEITTEELLNAVVNDIRLNSVSTAQLNS